MRTTLRSIKPLAFTLIFAAASFAAQPVPRPTQDFKLQDASSKPVSLTAQKGKVVVLQFLYTTCPHCQATAQWLSRLQSEFGPKGLQVYGVAFNDGVTAKDVKEFTQFAKFPVVASPSDPVMKYLGISIIEGYSVPMLVVIDRKGVVQAQSSTRPMRGEINEEPVMRALVTKLLSAK
jgi:peroxiredoxin